MHSQNTNYWKLAESMGCSLVIRTFVLPSQGFALRGSTISIYMILGKESEIADGLHGSQGRWLQ